MSCLVHLEDRVFEVKDGTRVLQFNGTLLAKSSSWRRGSQRWIEFELYRTENGSYVLSRIGVSVVFHSSTCPLVNKYGLHEVDSSEQASNSLPCDICRPSEYLPLLYPETNRYWAQVSAEPAAVLEALYKYDEGGARYLTNVAQRLLELGAEKDVGIRKTYSIEVIP